MTSKVLARCQGCGIVELRAADITIFVAAAASNIYGFNCPLCAEWNVSETGPNVVELLLRAGAHVGTAQPPEHLTGPITRNDITEFRRQLDLLPTAVH